MPLVIRRMGPNDARAFLEVHHAAVREIAAKDYPSAVVDDWAQLPLTEEAIERVRANPDDEYRLVAEIDGRVVGIGALVVENSSCEPAMLRRGRPAREWARRWCEKWSGLPGSEDWRSWKWTRRLRPSRFTRARLPGPGARRTYAWLRSSHGLREDAQGTRGSTFLIRGCRG